MNREDIYRMAQEAGFMTLCINEDTWIPYLSRFAKLVAAAEREACVKLVDEEMADYRYGTPPNIALNNAAAAIRERGAP